MTYCQKKDGQWHTIMIKIFLPRLNKKVDFYVTCESTMMNQLRILNTNRQTIILPKKNNNKYSNCSMHIFPKSASDIHELENSKEIIGICQYENHIKNVSLSKSGNHKEER